MKSKGETQCIHCEKENIILCSGCNTWWRRLLLRIMRWGL